MYSLSYLLKVLERLFWLLTRYLCKKNYFCEITLFNSPCAHHLALYESDFQRSAYKQMHASNIYYARREANIFRFGKRTYTCKTIEAHTSNSLQQY